MKTFLVSGCAGIATDGRQFMLSPVQQAGKDDFLRAAPARVKANQPGTADGLNGPIVLVIGGGGGSIRRRLAEDNKQRTIRSQAKRQLGSALDSAEHSRLDLSGDGIPKFGRFTGDAEQTVGRNG